MAGELYLTPQTSPATFKCRRVRMPLDANFFSAVNGALLQLTYPENWVQGTGITPAAAAALADEMYADFVQSLGDCMIGQVTEWAGAALPAGWLDCDGTTYLKTDYPDLYAALDAAFIVDASHFIVPDLRGRSVVGVGAGSGLTPRAMNDTGGEENHVLTTVELAAHTHTDSGHTHTEGSTVPTAITIGPGAPAPAAIGSPSITGTGFSSIQSAGSDSPHNTMHPFGALRFIIQAE